MSANISDRVSVLPCASLRDPVLIIRGHKIMLAPHLAQLYGVESEALLQAVAANPDRFPEDFMFQLTDKEFSALKSQTLAFKATDTRAINSTRAVSKREQQTTHLRYAFTEQGVAMLSSVLHSPQAVKVNIEIMRAYE